MTIADDDRTGDSPETPATARQPGRRRLRTVAGAAGLAALLGSGAYLATTWTADKDEAAVQESQARAPLASASVDAAASTTAGEQPAPKKQDDDANAKSGDQYKSPEQRVEEAREAAAKNGVEIKRPLPPDTDPQRQVAAAAAKVTTTGSTEKGETMRVITAKGDLTGQRELAWVAGGITEHGDVECSQTVRLANETKAQKRPNLLLCWRTSAKRSVVTVTVDPDGKPSKTKSAAVIDREWSKLG